jgi:hypothetical protein
MPGKKKSIAARLHHQKEPPAADGDGHNAQTPLPGTGGRAPAAVRRFFHGEMYTLTGQIARVLEMSPQELASNIELLEPLIKPYQCGPVAPANWVVLRSYQKILEWRDEIRMDETGHAHGDRSMKCAYQTALRNIARFDASSAADKAEAVKAKMKGMPTADGDRLLLGPLRSHEYAVLHAFRFLMGGYWHRHLLPFGCYAIEKPTNLQGAVWEDWRKRHVVSKANGSLMNPCAVTSADILYLCGTQGYLDRFIFTVSIILWAKAKYKINLLMHRSAGTSRDGGGNGNQQFDEYMTLEKHLHLFGSVYMHKRIMETSENWAGKLETIRVLDSLLKDCYLHFVPDRNSLNRDLENMIVEQFRGSLTGVQAFFPNAVKLSTDKKAGAP